MGTGYSIPELVRDFCEAMKEVRRLSSLSPLS